MFPFLILIVSLVASGGGLGDCLDGLTGAIQGTTPATASPTSDNDADGLTYAFEVKYRLNPNNPDSNGNGLLDSAENPDGDGLSNLGELLSAPTRTRRTPTTTASRTARKTRTATTLPTSWSRTSGPCRIQ